VPTKNPLGLVRALAYVAWSDGRIRDEERAHFDALVADLAIPEDARARGREMLDDAPTLEDVVRDLVDEDDRRLAVTHALRLAHADGRYSTVEAERVERLAEALGISPEKLAELEAQVGDQLMPPKSAR
jgi:tellurite resistance protein